ncbi:podoplanin precursor [Cricetulus griseus]|uniref:Podoplanin n=1 Tax=Cricetulus griseus TaxID=10029 RepID=A0A061IGB9_CRIGR|nr:podoplanin precursor [Cricetulus griseus]
MWTAPALFWVLGSAWLWHFAQGAAIGPLEDDIVTPGTRDGLVTPGLEDRIATTGATGRLDESTGKGPLVPHTKIPFEELPTPGTSDPDGEEHKSTTTVRMVTSHSADKETSHPNKDNTADETQTTDKRDGLAVVTLVGIIVGVLLAIGFVGVIIIVVMRKISGRFSLIYRVTSPRRKPLLDVELTLSQFLPSRHPKSERPIQRELITAKLTRKIGYFCDPDINPHTYEHLIFDKEGKIIQ